MPLLLILDDEGSVAPDLHVGEVGRGVLLAARRADVLSGRHAMLLTAPSGDVLGGRQGRQVSDRETERAA